MESSISSKFRTGCGISVVAMLAATFAVFLSLPSLAFAQTESILYSFTGGSDGATPVGTLISDGAGNLYGATEDGGNTGAATCFHTGCGVVFELSPATGGGWTESVLYTFTGGSDGAVPLSGLVFDAAGNLYGTTAYGGNTSSSKCKQTLPGCGVVFKLSPGSGGPWTETVIYTFLGGHDGMLPQEPLSFDASGNLYGTTVRGGVGSCQGFTCGEIFELSPNGSGGWQYTVLHDFTAGEDGGEPSSGLTIDATGDLFGTTFYGGLFHGAQGCGTVYELSPETAGGFQGHIVQTFDCGGNGSIPYGGVILDAAGNLYGTTSAGGSLGTSGDCNTVGDRGCGLVYELSPVSGRYEEKILFLFPGTNGFAYPASALAMDSAGNLYGTDDGIFCQAQCGYLYEVLSVGGIWSETTLFTFTGGVNGSGVSNQNALYIDPNGNLIGGASIGGLANDCTTFNGCGLIYEISR